MKIKIIRFQKLMLTGILAAIFAMHTEAQNVGIAVPSPLNKVDIQTAIRTGVHPTGRPLYVTGLVGSDRNGIEFRHTNASQGIGFGYNTIYATGTSANQNLSFASKGNRPLSFYTNNIQRVVIDEKGRMTINADVNGPQVFKDSYPLRVQGSDQGIAITVNGFTENRKNFMTFWDTDSISPRGRIEGQSLDELLTSFDYIWNVTMQALAIAAKHAEAIACLAQPEPDPFDAGANWASSAIEAATLAEYVLSSKASYGVSYESGGADYAEWIEKANLNETFSIGDIVGVKDGKISKATEGADHLMVISMAPIVLGNMPEKGKEQNFEKVAFMGQVPVKVTGTVAMGDYILGTGAKGFGFAVPPAKMKAEDYLKIVGVSWSASTSGSEISIVKVAVGISNNKMAGIIAVLDEEILKKQETLATITSYLKEKDREFKLRKDEVTTPAIVITKPVDLETLPKNSLNNISPEFIKNVEANPILLTNALKKIREELQSRGYDISKVPELNKFLNDEKYFMQMYKQSSK